MYRVIIMRANEAAGTTLRSFRTEEEAREAALEQGGAEARTVDDVIPDGAEFTFRLKRLRGPAEGTGSGPGGPVGAEGDDA